MTAINFAHTERKIQSYVLKPLWAVMLIGLVYYLYAHVWWAAVCHLLFLLYVGAIGAKLRIHTGKTGADLAQGVTPTLLPAPDDDNGDLSHDEMFDLSRTMTHVRYLTTAALIVLLEVISFKFYWIIGATIVYFFVISALASGLIVALMSMPKISIRWGK